MTFDAAFSSFSSSLDATLAVSSIDLQVCEQGGAYRPAHAQEILAAARRLLSEQVRAGADLSSPMAVRDFLTVQLGLLEHEVFAVVFLDTQLRLLSYQEMFRGTVSQASVYPREVVKAALAANASAVLLVHNHPSGNPEPSRADEHLTQVLKSALALVDVRVLDHFIVAGSRVLSFAERGLL